MVDSDEAEDHEDEKMGSNHPRYDFHAQRNLSLGKRWFNRWDQRQDGMPAVMSCRGFVRGANPWRTEPQERYPSENDGRVVEELWPLRG